MTTDQEPETTKNDKVVWTIGLGFSVWALVTFFVLFRWWGMRRSGMYEACGHHIYASRPGVDLRDKPGGYYVDGEQVFIPFGIRCTFETTDPANPYVAFYDYGTLPLAIAFVALLAALVAVVLFRRRWARGSPTRTRSPESTPSCTAKRDTHSRPCT